VLEGFVRRFGLIVEMEGFTSSIEMKHAYER
jgi:hypothetical protein